jgi:hypothetical protein
MRFVALRALENQARISGLENQFLDVTVFPLHGLGALRLLGAAFNRMA